MRRFLDFTIRILVVVALFAGVWGLARTDRAAATPLAAHPGYSAPQTTFLVSNTFDNGAGSLRQAILDANTTPGEDVIHINAIGTVNLLSALPTITEAVTIFVEDAHIRFFRVDGQNQYRVLNIANVPVTISGLIVRNGVAFGTAPGGGINSEGDLTLNAVHVLNSSAGSGGGVYSSGSVVVNGGRYEGNSASNDGGGIFSEGPLTVNGSIIQNNHCTTGFECYGGGLHSGNTLTLANTQIISNTTAGLGGGLFADGAVFITGTLFISNTSASSGGGAAITGIGPVQITNSRFENNSSDNIGGGLANYSGDTTTLNNVDFVGNDAVFQGGGLNAGNVIINGGRFEGNTTSGSGGGLYAFNVVLTHTHFISNTAAAAGGAVVNSVAATDSSFEYNANIGLWAAVMVLTGTQFLNNSGDFPAALASSTRATNVLFANNSDDALRSFGEAMITDSQFMNNGRGILVQGPLTVINSLFVNNALGSVTQYDAGDVSIVNTLIASNSTPEGETAVSLAGDGTATLNHVTIASSELVTTTAITTSKEFALIQNTIVTNHAMGLNVNTGFVVLNHTLFHGNGLDVQGSVASDENRIIGDPLFVNPGVGDYHLQPGSPAIDAGMDAGITVDFEGDARPLLNGFDVGFDESASVKGLPFQIMLPIIFR